MNPDHRSRLDPATRPPAGGPVSAPVWLPRWVLHWLLRNRLRGVAQRIDTLERELAGEFGLAETAPLHDELARLQLLRQALTRRLAGRR